MSQARFDTYFHRRAARFSSFYRSEPVARLLGRGALFDRLNFAVDTATKLDAHRVLDVGCGSGPLFATTRRAWDARDRHRPGRGDGVTGQDPGRGHPDLVTVEQRGWEEITETDAYDVAVALGVFDYVDAAAELLKRMSGAAPHVVASFPAPGLRLTLRKVRYGARGVSVHPYSASDIDDLARGCQLVVAERAPLGHAGFAVHFARS